MIESIISYIAETVFSANLESRLVDSVIFFVSDAIKILLLLFVMIFAIGFLRTYISADVIKKKLAKKGFLKYLMASAFGTITPFCSCSSIPLFMGLVEAGVPLGVSLSFLITSPLINEVVIVLMFGLFGLKVTAAYIIAGMSVGIISGIILSRFGLEKNLIKLTSNNVKSQKYNSYKERVLFGYSEAKSITKNIWAWVLVGVAIGAIIHNYVPSQLIENIMTSLGSFAVLLATVLGIPMYGNGSGILPIAAELFPKGVPLGTALSFMMAVVGLSFPEAVILRRIMNLKLIGIFFGVVAIGIVLIGYLLNFITWI